jgi:pimeloyl-ACP methyl ester carboxylesterase
VCSFDFRFHGRSGDGIPTFGLAECWDIQATLDEADKYGSPKPYVLIGESLGAMAAQRTAIEDSRISGAVLLHPPAWPWDAIGKSIGDFTPLVGKLVNWSYGGRDVLTEGDIRTKNGHPAHNPKVLYMMGTHDKFDIQKAKQVYDHWYNGIPATWNRWPLDAPQEKKWFVAVDGACHPEGPPNTPFTVFDWPSFWPVLDQFLEIVLKAG